MRQHASSKKGCSQVLESDLRKVPRRVLGGRFAVDFTESATPFACAQIIFMSNTLVLENGLDSSTETHAESSWRPSVRTHFQIFVFLQLPASCWH